MFCYTQMSHNCHSRHCHMMSSPDGQVVYPGEQRTPTTSSQDDHIPTSPAVELTPKSVSSSGTSTPNRPSKVISTPFYLLKLLDKASFCYIIILFTIYIYIYIYITMNIIYILFSLCNSLIIFQGKN